MISKSSAGRQRKKVASREINIASGKPAFRKIRMAEKEIVGQLSAKFSWNCAFRDKSMKVGIELEQIQWSIFGYRGISKII